MQEGESKSSKMCLRCVHVLRLGLSAESPFIFSPGVQESRKKNKFELNCLERLDPGPSDFLVFPQKLTEDLEGTEFQFLNDVEEQVEIWWNRHAPGFYKKEF